MRKIHLYTHIHFIQLYILMRLFGFSNWSHIEWNSLSTVLSPRHTIPCRIYIQFLYDLHLFCTFALMRQCEPLGVCVCVNVSVRYCAVLYPRVHNCVCVVVFQFTVEFSLFCWLMTFGFSPIVFHGIKGTKYALLARWRRLIKVCLDKREGQ